MIAMTTKCEIYVAGKTAAKLQPGDFILTHHTTAPAKVIRAGQFLRYHGKMKKYSHWNHAALVVDASGTLIEAVGRGVSYGQIKDYHDVEYYLVRTKLSKGNQTQVVAAAESFLNDAYGWPTIFSLTVELLTGIKVQFGNPNSIICSALVSQCLWAGGIIFNTNPYRMMPADLAAAFNVEVCND